LIPLQERKGKGADLNHYKRRSVQTRTAENKRRRATR